jgi:hypothetical protein
MKKLILLIILSNVHYSLGQDKLNGKVYQLDRLSNRSELFGANVFWLRTTIGTTTDSAGLFTIPYDAGHKLLIVSFVGFATDTLLISENKYLEITLKPLEQVTNIVEVVDKKPLTKLDYFGIENSSTITSKELQLAACCNLSESFETNPSIDVSFTDAITGTKQIEMLGLSGIYTQTTMENLPYLRGLLANTGLTFIPGNWIQSINVSKGIGSVANGFESITGQIDVAIQKPISLEDEKFYLNLYGDYDRRYEGNLSYRLSLSEHLASITLIHASSRKHSKDDNSDMFMDMPIFKSYNIIQRWQFHNESGLENQFGFQILSDEKTGGSINHTSHSNNYRFNTKNKYYQVFGKTGFVLSSDDYKSFGLQWSLNSYSIQSLFGKNQYSGEQKSAFFNLIYQSDILGGIHKFRTGMSFMFNQYTEIYNRDFYNRIERIPGIFLEYTYKPSEILTLLTGLRIDNHNFYGTFVTSRLHLRYSLNEDLIFRIAAGNGYRNANIFIENSSVFASSRGVNIYKTNNYGYGLNQESAWNYGINATYYFLFDYRDATLSLDFYRTVFETVNITDLDSDPQNISIYSVNDGDFSNSFQAELNFMLIENLDTRAAYRFLSVKQSIQDKRIEKPFTSKHRALINLTYSTEIENIVDPQMIYNLTIQWFGEKRIPSTLSNPKQFQVGAYSPGFVLVNVQVLRKFNDVFEFYIGAENLFNFTQSNPIIDPENPFGKYFDASLVWGPIGGRMIYVGVRYKL